MGLGKTERKKYYKTNERGEMKSCHDIQKKTERQIDRKSEGNTTKEMKEVNNESKTKKYKDKEKINSQKDRRKDNKIDERGE